MRFKVTVLIMVFATFSWSADVNSLSKINELKQQNRYRAVFSLAFLAYVKSPDNGQLEMEVAEALYKLGDLDAAKFYADRCLQRGIDTDKPKTLLEKISKDRDKIQDRINQIEEALAVRPKDATPYMNLAAIYIGMKNKMEAKEILNRAYSETNKDSRIRMMIQIYQQQLEKPSIDSKISSHKALKLYQEGKKQEAFSEIRKALELSIIEPVAFDNLLTMELRELNATGSCAVMRHILLLSPNKRNYQEMARLCIIAGRYNEALRVLSEILNTYGDDLMTHYYMGIVYEKVGDTESSKKQFNLAFERNSELTNRNHNEMTIRGVTFLLH